MDIVFPTTKDPSRLREPPNIPFTSTLTCDDKIASELTLAAPS
jgi:hypothetical protein